MATNDDIKVDQILDRTTIQVAKTLIENPTVPYPANSLAEQSGVSKDPVYDRLEEWKKAGLIEEFETGSSTTHYTLNADSEFTEAMTMILDDTLGILTGEE